MSAGKRVSSCSSPPVDRFGCYLFPSPLQAEWANGFNLFRQFGNEAWGGYKMATAKELMSDAVRGVHESATMREAIALLAHHDLTGLPVIDSAGFLQGVLSQADTLSAFSNPDVFDDLVTKHMTNESLTVEESDTVEHVAKLFQDKNIHRAPVVHGPSVVGMISRTDLVRYLSQFV